MLPFSRNFKIFRLCIPLEYVLYSFLNKGIRSVITLLSYTHKVINCNYFMLIPFYVYRLNNVYSYLVNSFQKLVHFYFVNIIRKLTEPYCVCCVTGKKCSYILSLPFFSSAAAYGQFVLFAFFFCFHFFILSLLFLLFFSLS